jgi:WhiB family redox-sensing transcriptional regulator
MEEVQDDAAAWMLDAACREYDPEVFFPHDGAGTAVARSICFGCPVRWVCLEYALANNIDHGIWGGESERERRKMRRRRRMGRAA